MPRFGLRGAIDDAVQLRRLYRQGLDFGTNRENDFYRNIEELERRTSRSKKLQTRGLR
jgi:hypothetical protein